jgi:hypothetical protein
LHCEWRYAWLIMRAGGAKPRMGKAHAEVRGNPDGPADRRGPAVRGARPSQVGQPGEDGLEARPGEGGPPIWVAPVSRAATVSQLAMRRRGEPASCEVAANREALARREAQPGREAQASQASHET